MSDSAKKYPKEVKGIYIAGTNGGEGQKVDVDPDSDGSGRHPRVSKAHRDFDNELRAMSLAAGTFFKSYLEHHDASNEMTRDGALKHFGKNTIKAHKAAVKVLKDKSRAFDFDPTEVHENILEFIEDLEDENDEE